MSNFITKTGLAELQTQYEELVNIKIPEVLAGLNDALSAGDLKENAARDVLLIEQQRLTGEKQRIESILNDYAIIDEDSLAKSKRIRIGSTVKIHYNEEDKDVVIKIIGTSEADVLLTIPKIGNDSPLAQSLIGKLVGDEITVRVKQKKLSAKVMEILD